MKANLIILNINRLILLASFIKAQNDKSTMESLLDLIASFKLEFNGIFKFVREISSNSDEYSRSNSARPSSFK